VKNEWKQGQLEDIFRHRGSIRIGLKPILVAIAGAY